jgi:hypothetical protein
MSNDNIVNIGRKPVMSTISNTNKEENSEIEEASEVKDVEDSPSEEND